MLEDYHYIPIHEETLAMEQTAQFFNGIHRSTASLDVGLDNAHSKSNENVNQNLLKFYKEIIQKTQSFIVDLQAEKNTLKRVIPSKKRNSSSYSNISQNLRDIQRQPVVFVQGNKDSQKNKKKVEGEEYQDKKDIKQSSKSNIKDQFQRFSQKDQKNSKDYKIQKKEDGFEDQNTIQKRVSSVETSARVQNQRISNNQLDSDTLFWSKIGQIVSAPETTLGTKINQQNSQQQIILFSNQQQQLSSPPQPSKYESDRQQSNFQTSSNSSMSQDFKNLFQKGFRFFKQQDNLRQSLITTLPISNNSRTLSSNSTSTSDPSVHLKNFFKMNSFIQSNQSNRRTPFFNESYCPQNIKISIPTQGSQSQLQATSLFDGQSIQSRNHILGKNQNFTKNNTHNNNHMMQSGSYLPNFLHSSPNKPLQSILSKNEQNHESRLVPAFSEKQLNNEKAKESLKKYDADRERHAPKNKASSSLRGFPVSMNVTAAEYKEQSKENHHQEHEKVKIADPYPIKKNMLLKTDRRGNTGNFSSNARFGQRALEKRVNVSDVEKLKINNVSQLSLIRDQNEGEKDESGVNLFSFCLDQTQEQQHKQQSQQSKQFNENDLKIQSTNEKKIDQFCSGWAENNSEDTALDCLKIQINKFQSILEKRHSSNTNSRSKFNLKCKQQQNVVKKIFNFDNANSPPASANPLNLGTTRQSLLKTASERASTQQTLYNYVDKLQLIQPQSRYNSGNK